MAKKRPLGDDDNGGKAWREGDLITTFGLNRIVNRLTPSMSEWLDVEKPVLDVTESAIFERSLAKAQKSITGWSEEELKNTEGVLFIAKSTPSVI